jgi:hypothetical protein
MLNITTHQEMLLRTLTQTEYLSRVVSPICHLFRAPQLKPVRNTPVAKVRLILLTAKEESWNIKRDKGHVRKGTESGELELMPLAGIGQNL